MISSDFIRFEKPVVIDGLLYPDYTLIIPAFSSIVCDLNDHTDCTDHTTTETVDLSIYVQCFSCGGYRLDGVYSSICDLMKAAELADPKLFEFGEGGFPVRGMEFVCPVCKCYMMAGFVVSKYASQERAYERFIESIVEYRREFGMREVPTSFESLAGFRFDKQSMFPISDSIDLFEASHDRRYASHVTFQKDMKDIMDADDLDADL